MLHRLKQAIKNDLIAGLLVVIPLATTIWLSISVSSWVLATHTDSQAHQPLQNMAPLTENAVKPLPSGMGI
ncbi:hypothetical protein BRW62_07315 [Parathermosynechococcus lividus PCC 6715]|uniref:Uncharacterized protein n=1 Tax=Parathermosynechococcus lividus PCC 6715 TaxID=1917166 RepID=A0A2D2Q288_PARLV|nr:hypothetical protein BRW62_07315 [Thermostichus lividus PCC 6715]